MPDPSGVKKNVYRANPNDGSLWYYKGSSWMKVPEKTNPETGEQWVYWNDAWMPRSQATETGVGETPTEAVVRQAKAAPAPTSSMAGDTAASLLTVIPRQADRLRKKAAALTEVVTGSKKAGEYAKLLTSGSLPNIITDLSKRYGDFDPAAYESERLAGRFVQGGGDIVGDVAPVVAASTANPLLGALVAGGTGAGGAAENVVDNPNMTLNQKRINVAGHGALNAALAMIPGGPGAKLEAQTLRGIGKVGLAPEASLGKQLFAAGVGTGGEATLSTMLGNALNIETGATPQDTSLLHGLGQNLLLPGAARLGRGGFGARTPFVSLEERQVPIDATVARPDMPEPTVVRPALEQPSISSRELPTIGMNRGLVEPGVIDPEYIPPQGERVPPVIAPPPADVKAQPVGGGLGAPDQVVGTPDPMSNRGFFSIPNWMRKPSRNVQEDPILYGPGWQAIVDAVEERSKFQARHAAPLKAAAGLTQAEMRDLSRAVLTREFRQTGQLPEGIALNPRQKAALDAIVGGNRAMSNELIQALEDAASKASGKGAETLKAVAERFKTFQKDNPGYIRLMREGDWEKRVSYTDPQSGEIVTLAMLRGTSKGDVEKQFQKLIANHPDIAEALTTRQATTTDPVRIVKGERPSNPSAAKIAQALEDSGMPKEYASQVASAYDDLVMGEGYNRFAASQKQAKFIPGFVEDIGEAYKSSIGLTGNQLVNLTHGKKALDEIARLGAARNVQGQPAYSESAQWLRGVFDQAMSNPLAATPAGRAALAARNLNFIRQMGLDTGMVLPQAYQKVTHDLPTMVSDYGLKGALFQVRGNRLATEIMASPRKGTLAINESLVGDPPPGLTKAQWVDELRAFVDSEINSNLLTSEALQDIRGYSNSPFARAIEKATEVGGVTMNKTETHNRLATMLGNYMAARTHGFNMEAGVTQPSQIGRSTGVNRVQLSPEEAAILARRRTGEVNNLGGSINMSPVETTPVGSLLTQYKFFPVEYVQQMKANYKNVRDRYRNMGATEIGANLAAMGPSGVGLATAMAGAGQRGIPYAMTLWAAAKGAKDLFSKQAPDAPVEEQLDNWGRSTLKDMGVGGQDLEDALGLFKRGLPHAMNLDLSGRIGLSDPLNIRDAKDPKDLFASAAGPTHGTGKDLFDAVALARQGDKSGAVGKAAGRTAGSLVRAVKGEKAVEGGGVGKSSPAERLLQLASLRTAEQADIGDRAKNRSFDENQLKEWAQDAAKRYVNADTPEAKAAVLDEFKKSVKELAGEGRTPESSSIGLNLSSTFTSAVTAEEKRKRGFGAGLIKQKARDVNRANRQ